MAMFECATPTAAPLPGYAAWAHGVLSCMLGCALLWVATLSFSDHGSVLAQYLSLLFLVTLLGHVRRVAWGRGLGALFSVLAAFVVVAMLMPDPYDGDPGILPAALPVWLRWAVIVSAAVATLLPTTIVGLRRAWFSDAWW
ncbi:MAG TPA: hypothetical protein VFS95_05295 [Telluria sp.]|nr:hypothetical protein [Telluria sp.]